MREVSWQNNKRCLCNYFNEGWQTITGFKRSGTRSKTIPLNRFEFFLLLSKYFLGFQMKKKKLFHVIFKNKLSKIINIKYLMNKINKIAEQSLTKKPTIGIYFSKISFPSPKCCDP